MTMHQILEQFKTTMPFPEVFPEEFNQALPTRDYMSFRNLAHFCHVVSKLTQKKDDYCGITYEKALSKLLKGESDFPKAEQASVRNLVRSNLQKRGLITEETYEAFKYAVDGINVGVDVARYVNGQADCVITPAVQYVDFFYELYVSISYPWTTPNSVIRKNCAKLLATVEELERQHIFIKIAIVFPDRNATKAGSNFFADIPLFSHKDAKSVETMSAVINDRLLRKFFFAILENFYGSSLAVGYGHPVTMNKCMNIGDEFNEINFFQEVVCTVGA
jgi:hypothetical protein